MHLPISSLLCLLALVLGVTGQLKYWLDETCRHYPLPMGETLSLSPYLKEMFYMAELAKKRMLNDKDSADLRDIEFRRMYKLLFKTDLNADSRQKYEYGLEYKEFFGLEDDSAEARDTAYNIVYNTLDSISTTWTETENRLEADNRIYCDNGRHFSESGKDDKSVDPVNNIWTTADCESDGLYAFVTCELYDEEDEQDTDPCLLTVCDNGLQDFRYPGMSGGGTTPERPFLLSELIEEDKVTAGLPLNKHASLVNLLFHEWSHTQPHLTEDWYFGDDMDTGATGEWKVLMDIPDTRRAVINAEALSFIGLSALLIEGKDAPKGHFYTMQLDYESLPNKEHPNIGKISFYDD
ncbi:hypothetical protein F5X68DRAFT_251295 [Plectosphaerella plurivora]|uniref:Lysine-specific metallo-endopeptidase domain-containing protein n=1 Tax=Plectosphaerella plurivora TaxID=936078 RepID=A0A9P8V0T8_9PEZI|nr:hypothetical protein F5X68DRAFT_251295 [Plectosphaerella plurivora]